MVLLALAGPAMLILSMALMLLFPSKGLLFDAADATGLAGAVLTFVGLAASVAWLVRRWSKGPRKLLWYLLVALNSIIVVPITILLVSGRFG